MRKVGPAHHLSWFAAASWYAKAPPSATRELNRHGKWCGFLGCLEAKSWTGSHRGVNHGAACLPASAWGHTSRDVSTQPCSRPLLEGELFRAHGRDLCLLVCLSADAFCVSWGPSRWENWAIVTQPKGISSRGKNSLTTLSHVLLPWDQSAWKAILYCLFAGLD